MVSQSKFNELERDSGLATAQRVEFLCPSCSARLSVTADRLGSTGCCPYCKSSVSARPAVSGGTVDTMSQSYHAHEADSGSATALFDLEEEAAWRERNRQRLRKQRRLRAIDNRVEWIRSTLLGRERSFVIGASGLMLGLALLAFGLLAGR